MIDARNRTVQLQNEHELSKLRLQNEHEIACKGLDLEERKHVRDLHKELCLNPSSQAPAQQTETTTDSEPK